MRKRYKNKKRVCSLCKGHKRGYEKRFTVRELASRKEAEKLIQEWRN